MGGAGLVRRAGLGLKLSPPRAGSLQSNTMKTSFTYTTQASVRRAFWESHPQFRAQARRVPFRQNGRALYRAKVQNEYPATIRSAFVDFVDGLNRDGSISDALADRVTL